MNFIKSLSFKNLKRKPGRTIALVLLSAFLAFSVFGGSVVVLSLRNGLKSYEARLGADIVVIPNQARSKGTLDSILLQGIPGYFYMDNAYYEKIKEREGVDIASPQFFLASASSGCCSVPVQIIGFDPETDFSIQPWIQESYKDTISDNDIVVGSNITIPVNKKLTFYDLECDVVSKLSPTGTGLDNAVYANMDTIKQMMQNASDLGFDYFEGTSPDSAVSAVMIKVEDGYSIEDVNNDINIHVRRVTSTPARSMISGIAGGLEGVSGTITVIVVLVWILGIIILIVAFAMISNERTKEFAILRTMGASRKMLSGLLKWESFLIGLAGSVAGVLLASLVIFPFAGIIRNKLDLPYLLPGIGTIILLALGAVIISVGAGLIASRISSSRTVKNETGLILREGA